MKVRALVAGSIVGGLLSIGGGVVVNAEPNPVVANFGQVQKACIAKGDNFAAAGVRPATRDANGVVHVSGAEGFKLLNRIGGDCFMGP